MAERGSAPTTEEEGVLVIERIFDAPRELVWRAWTDPKIFVQWFGPKGFATTAFEIDLRVGGRWLHCMRSPEGQDIWGTGVYLEIVPLERFVSTNSFADENGNVVAPTHYGMPEDVPLEVLVTVTFEDLGGKTRMTLRHEGLPAAEMIEGAGTGWNESFDRLAAYLAEA